MKKFILYLHLQFQRLLYHLGLKRHWPATPVARIHPLQRAREIQERLKNDPEFAAIVMAEGIRRGIITPSRDEDAVAKDPNITTEEW